MSYRSASPGFARSNPSSVSFNGALETPIYKARRSDPMSQGFKWAAVGKRVQVPSTVCIESVGRGAYPRLTSQWGGLFVLTALFDGLEQLAFPTSQSHTRGLFRSIFISTLHMSHGIIQRSADRSAPRMAMLETKCYASWAAHEYWS
jgi:hypothetical protein